MLVTSQHYYKELPMIFPARRIIPIVLAVALSTLLLACSKANEESAATAPAIQTSTTPQAAASAPTEATSEESSAYEEGVPGGVKQRVTTITASVKSIDYQKRTLTMDDTDGKEITIAVGPENVNFAQIQQGDRINAEFVEQVIISLKEKDDMPSENSADATVSRAPEGNKPAVEVAANQITTATVTAIDVPTQTATLQFADGSSQVVNVRPDIELKPEQVGREVVFETSQYMMLKVEKAPQQ
jgi:hypothetical protein